MTTSTVIRVKRRLEDNPQDALVLMCKRAKTEFDELSPSLFVFRGTVKSQETSQVKTVVPNNDIKLKSTHSVNDIIEKIRKEKKDKSTQNRYEVINLSRGLKDDCGDDDDDQFHLVDLQKKVEDEEANVQYAYDLYTAPKQDFDISMLDRLVSIEDYETDLILGSYRDNGRETPSGDEVDDDDDSNDENNWRNEYPDSDPSSIDEEDMVKAMTKVDIATTMYPHNTDNTRQLLPGPSSGPDHPSYSGECKMPSDDTKHTDKKNLMKTPDLLTSRPRRSVSESLEEDINRLGISTKSLQSLARALLIEQVQTQVVRETVAMKRRNRRKKKLRNIANNPISQPTQTNSEADPKIKRQFTCPEEASQPPVKRRKPERRAPGGYKGMAKSKIDHAVMVVREDGAQLDKEAAIAIRNTLSNIIDKALDTDEVDTVCLQIADAELVSEGLFLATPMNIETQGWLLGLDLGSYNGVPLKMRKVGRSRVMVSIPGLKDKVDTLNQLKRQNNYRTELRLSEWYLIRSLNLPLKDKLIIGVPEDIHTEGVWLDYMRKVVKLEYLSSPETNAPVTTTDKATPRTEKACVCLVHPLCPTHKERAGLFADNKGSGTKRECPPYVGDSACSNIRPSRESFPSSENPTAVTKDPKESGES